MKNVIHIYGAAGSGTSTLGRKVSEELIFSRPFNKFHMLDGADALEENFGKVQAAIHSFSGAGSL